MENNTNRGCTIDFSFSGLIFTLLTIFITLKLCNLIAWSWWWVLSPLWIPLPLFGIAFCVVYFTAKLLDKALRSRTKKYPWM